jgi:acyl-CoA thioester hydrolase
MTTIRVRFHELDPYGHVNHGIYLNYFEHARIERLDEVGFGLDRLRELGFALVVVEAHVKFLRPAVAGDVLTVDSEVVDVRPASSRWQQRLRRGDELLAMNQVRAAITDLSGRPTAAPAGLVEAMRAMGPPGDASAGTGG